MKSFVCRKSKDTIDLGIKIGSLLKAGDIVTLNGDLGAGKTTISKGIARSLEIQEEVTSPTYTIISEYEGSLPLYHLDLYRIDGVEEFELLGADELLFGRGISLIEWSERIAEYLPDDVKSIHLRIQDDGSRLITLGGMEL